MGWWSLNGKGQWIWGWMCGWIWGIPW